MMNDKDVPISTSINPQATPFQPTDATQMMINKSVAPKPEPIIMNDKNVLTPTSINPQATPAQPTNAAQMMNNKDVINSTPFIAI